MTDCERLKQERDEALKWAKTWRKHCGMLSGFAEEYYEKPYLEFIKRISKPSKYNTDE